MCIRDRCTYHAHYESEVLQAVESIDRRLDDQNDISFYDYGAIAVYSIIVKHFLGIDIQSIKSKLAVSYTHLRSMKTHCLHSLWTKSQRQKAV